VSDQIEWLVGEPPPGNPLGRRLGSVAAFANALKSRPGAWATFPKTWMHANDGSAAAANVAFRLRRKHGCEAVYRVVGDKVFVYARWPKAGGDGP
jgi:hypothetical protein